MRSKIGLILLFALLLGLACQPAEQAEAPPEDTTAADVAAIQGIRDAYVAADNASDAAGIAALYAENAMFLPPNQPAVSGPAAVQTHYETIFSTMTPTLAVSGRETRAAGDWGYDTGTFNLKLTPKAGGDPTEISGKYIVIAGRQMDGSWKITNMLFNSDAPMPPLLTGAGQ